MYNNFLFNIYLVKLQDKSKLISLLISVAEIFNAYLLYKLSQEIGEAKITETFIDLNSNTYKDLKLFIKRLVELHPEDTATICKTVDEVFYFKASDEEFYEMVGNTEATQDYAGKRSIAKAKYENILKYRYEQLKNAITEKAKIINKFGQKLAKSLKSDNKESTEKCSGLFTNFINNVKVGISKGVEVTRNHVDPIFDKIKDFFNKGNTIEDITNKSSSEDDNKTNNSVDNSSENLDESDNSSETIKKEFIPSSSNDEQDQGSLDDPFSILR